MDTITLDPSDIVVGERLRELRPTTVESLKDSIARVGLKTPISVRFLSEEDGFELVAGRHRLQACIELGLAEIEAREETGTEIDARLWEIAENLHRAELTELERAEHIEEWRKLIVTKEQQGGQLAAPLGGRQPAEKGFRKTARELGITNRAARRWIAVAKLEPEAKAEARTLHLDDNQSALLSAARGMTKEDQLRRLREHAAKKAAGKTDVTASEQRIESAVSAVKRLSPEELLVFADWFDGYRADGGAAVFDHTATGLRAVN